MSADTVLAGILNKRIETDRNNHSNLFSPNDSTPELRLRLAKISNPTETNASKKDELDISNTIDNYNYRTTLSWMQGNKGGVFTGNSLSGSWDYIPENDNYDVKNRKPMYNVTSAQPCVQLSSPFIWTGKKNSCGINFIPPQDSVAITGQTANGQTVILGYVPSNPQIYAPVLKAGEVCISGYGNNFMHFNQSDKITIHCNSIEGEYDRSDSDYNQNKENCKKNISNCEVEININANDRFIEIIAKENSDNTNMDNYNKLNKYPKELNGNQTSYVLVTPNDITMYSKDEKNNISKMNISSTIINRSVENNEYKTEENITFDTYKISTRNFIVEADNVNMISNGNFDEDNLKFNVNSLEVNAKKINLNSIEETTIHSDNKINIDIPIVEEHPHTGEYSGKDLELNINACHINTTTSNISSTEE